MREPCGEMIRNVMFREEVTLLLQRWQNSTQRIVLVMKMKRGRVPNACTELSKAFCLRPERGLSYSFWDRED